jgi:hypothetical protein
VRGVAFLLIGCAVALSPLFCDCTPSLPTDASIYTALVEGGCLAASDGGVAAVHAQHVAADQPAWLACMYVTGSTVQTCAVPCTRGEAGP